MFCYHVSPLESIRDAMIFIMIIEMALSQRQSSRNALTEPEIDLGGDGSFLVWCCRANPILLSLLHTSTIDQSVLFASLVGVELLEILPLLHRPRLRIRIRHQMLHYVYVSAADP